MGRPKAFLEVDGQPVLLRVVEHTRTVCAHTVVVGSAGEALPPLPAGIVRVDDPATRPHLGPLSGLATGLQTLDELGVELAYLGACDAVFLTAAHVRHMLDLLAQDRRHAAVVPETGPLDDGTRVLHPLSGAVRVHVARTTAAALLQSGQRAARALYAGLAARRIGVASLPDPRVVRGCNTPEEWAAAVAELGAT